MRAYLLTFFSAATLFSAYGAPPNFSTSTKTNLGPFGQGDTGDIYVIHVINSGMATCCAPVTVTDTLPTGLSNPVVKDNPANYSCTTTASSLTCTTSNVIIHNEDDLLVFEVNVSNTAPTPIMNSVVISGGAAATVTINGPSQTITPEPYLTITKTQSSPVYNGNPLPVGYGQSLTNRIDVDNIGGAAASIGSVTVVDTVASDMIVTSAAGVGWTCGHSTTVVTCTNTASIPAGSAAQKILVTAVLLGSTASDVASVTFISTVNMVMGATTNTTQTVSSTVNTLTKVTFSSNQTQVNVDGVIYPSGITIPENLNLNHTITALSTCSIFGATDFNIVETRPAGPPGPWMEVTGQITGQTVVVNCN
jgi:hypothetical protein